MMLKVFQNELRRPLARVWSDFDRLFDGVLVPAVREAADVRFWDFRVSDHGGEVVVRAELPGFEEKDLDVQIHKGVLIVKAERKQESTEGRRHASYHRSVTLPERIDVDRATATYRNGVLELHLPREAEVQPRRIPVQGTEATIEPVSDTPVAE